MSVEDTRIAYGQRCVWWDDIANVGLTAPVGGVLTREDGTRVIVPSHSLPCCPRCGSMLMEMPSEADFLAGAAHYEREGNPGYVAFIVWLKGKCFKTIELAWAAYDLERSKR